MTSNLLKQVSIVMWAAKIKGLDAGQRALEHDDGKNWMCGRAEIRLRLAAESEIGQALFELAAPSHSEDGVVSCVHRVEEMSDSELAVEFTNMTLGTGQEMTVQAAAYEAALAIIRRELGIEGRVLAHID